MNDGELLRADIALTRRGLCESREKAQRMIDAGLVRLNGKPLTKASSKVSDADILETQGALYPYVSRGGLKLARALEVFREDVRGAVCVDVGASTGGFTDVLLQNGASKVYAVDVGSGQLDPRLQADPRVISMEHTNARTLSKDMFEPVPSVGVMDVSFISVRLIWPALFELLGQDGRVISLIKPQFEAGRSAIGKNGIVQQATDHIRVLQEITDFAPGHGWYVHALTVSPVTGGDGNIEFLALLKPEEHIIEHRSIRELVSEAHRRQTKTP